MEKFKFIKKAGYPSKGWVERLPKNAGVYSFKNNKEILYIGKASNIRERVKNHFQSAFAKASARQATFRDSLFIDKVRQIGFIKTNSEIEALILEANLIKKYQPKYNVIWRDDKNYFFVGITRENYPRVFITHQPKQKLEIRNLKFEINYMGPFVDGKALKQTLKILRKIFPYRSCNKIPNRPCLWYHLNYCPAPCFLKSPKESLRLPTGQAKFINRVPRSGARWEMKRSFSDQEIPQDSLQIKRTSEKNAKNLMKIIEGKKESVLRDLKKEIKLASKNLEFEKAAKIRDQIEALEKVIIHARIFEPPGEAVEVRPQQALKKILKIKKDVTRIEAYDISNIQGKEATGSMVTFINGRANKNFYRKFKIKIAQKPNDVAMIKGVLNRRFKHPEWPYPDLILIDGGIAQLSATLKIKNQNLKIKNQIKVLSLAKKENKLFIEGYKNPILLKNLPREIFNLILQLRDEAHRFAISYHKKLRYKELIPK